MIDIILLASVNPNIHKECLKAKDYLGCVEVFNKSNSDNIKSRIDNYRTNDLGEKCISGKRIFCIAKRGKDILGMPKVIGWYYREVPEINAVIYYNPQPFKLKVRESFGRYIHLESVMRRYKSPKSGSPSYTIGGGTTQTNCYNYGGSISCTSSTDPGIKIRGKSAEPGGNIQSKIDTLIDCQDNTYEDLIDKAGGKWKPIKKNSFTNFLANKHCQNISEHIESSITKYSKRKKR